MRKMIVMLRTHVQEDVTREIVNVDLHSGTRIKEKSFDLSQSFIVKGDKNFL